MNKTCLDRFSQGLAATVLVAGVAGIAGTAQAQTTASAADLLDNSSTGAIVLTDAIVPQTQSLFATNGFSPEAILAQTAQPTPLDSPNQLPPPGQPVPNQPSQPGRTGAPTTTPAPGSTPGTQPTPLNSPNQLPPPGQPVPGQPDRPGRTGAPTTTPAPGSTPGAQPTPLDSPNQLPPPGQPVPGQPSQPGRTGAPTTPAPGSTPGAQPTPLDSPNQLPPPGQPVPGQPSQPSPTVPPSTTTPTPPTTRPAPPPRQGGGIQPGRDTATGSSYVGAGFNIGLGEGGTAVGDGSFALFSKIGLTQTISIRPAVLFSDNATFLLPVTFDFIPLLTPATREVGEAVGLRVSPFVGGGAALSTGDDDTSLDFLLMGGVDVPVSDRLTATAQLNVTFVDNTALGLLLGLGYNF